MTEGWRDIPGHPGYQASTRGRVRSIDRQIVDALGRARLLRGRVLKLDNASDDPYLRVALWSANVPARYLVHTLIARTYLGPQPDGMEVCHSDHDPQNNCPDNLAYGTHIHNVQQTIAADRDYPRNLKTCLRGHDLVVPNLTKSGMARGVRQCRSCYVAHCWRHARRARGVRVTDEQFESHANNKYGQIMEKRS